MRAIFPESAAPVRCVVANDEPRALESWEWSPFGGRLTFADGSVGQPPNSYEAVLTVWPCVTAGGRTGTLVRRFEDGRLLVTASGWRLPEGEVPPPQAVMTPSLDEVESLFQYRASYLPHTDTSPAPFLYRMPEIPEPDPEEGVEEHLAALKALIAEHAPERWLSARIEVEALSGWQVLTATARQEGAEGVVHWYPPLMVGQWFDRLRSRMYRSSRGAWYKADLTFTPDGEVVASYDWQSEPRWRTFTFRHPNEHPNPLVKHDLLRFPRAVQDAPEWVVRANSDGLDLEVTPEHGVLPWPEPPVPAMIPARVFEHFSGNDETGYRVASHRPRLHPDERQLVLSYLNNAVAVLTGRGLEVDRLDPAHPETVPSVFLTDGRWVWAGMIAYYLERHDLPPEPGLLAHIRSQRYLLPERVSSVARARALSYATNRQGGLDLADLEPGVAEEVETALDAARGIAEHLGLNPMAYSLGEHADGAINLVRQDDDFVVYWDYRGRRQFFAAFDNPGDAATYLIGFFYSYTTALREPVDLPQAQGDGQGAAEGQQPPPPGA
ncbi:hypothetical protein [Actinosynnema pretiosum]|uniref:Uncharacterized protein n=1 Tax=Actinosynnema pretiosum TaxID=42197 RepID=A0A290ZEQ8_9PSEU|nr:hypothetical protein [Actinosynnema pretiosum]ATE57452.1 hypothetical protein CNX65_32505 [Actinosynnema pretiosum]